MRYLNALLLALIALSCSESGPADPIDENPTVDAGFLDVSVDSATVAVFEKVTPNVTVRDVNGEPMDLRTIEWTSSDPSVVEVDSLGVMTALAPGIAEIVATAEPLEHRITIRVADVTAVALIPQEDSLLVGERLSYRLEIESDIPFSPSVSRFTWSVSSGIIGRVRAPGIIHAGSVGDLTIYASIGHATGSADVRVFDLGTAYVGMAATTSATCALREPGLPYCWGENFMVGVPAEASGLIGKYEVLPMPHDPEGLYFDTLASNHNLFCGLRDGAAYCWGLNTAGMLGPGFETAVLYPLPSPLQVDIQIASITLGSSYICVLDAEGRAYCWGSNTSGQLGDGTLVSRSTAAPVAGDHRFESIHAGGNHVCGMTTAGEVRCWGDDSEGAVRGAAAAVPCDAPFLGGPCVPVPVVPEGTPALRTVAAGGSFGFDERTCGIDFDDRLWCWGSDHGDPAPIDGRAYRSVVLGQDHGCALGFDRRAWCFGSNVYGKLASPVVGPGVTLTPVPVYGDIQFSTIALGSEHTCGISFEGAIAYCWGLNQQGQLGLGHLDPGIALPRAVSLP